MTTISQQTGWVRPGPKCMCQDWDALLAVKEFSYCLDAPGFVEYVQARTGQRIANEEYLHTLHPVNRAKVQDLWELFRSASDGPEERQEIAEIVEKMRKTIFAENIA